MQTKSSWFMNVMHHFLNDCSAAEPSQPGGRNSSRCYSADRELGIAAELMQFQIDKPRREKSRGFRTEKRKCLLEHVGVSAMREEKSSVCCCSPALQAEIRLINSSHNVEMSSMTSILDAKAQQHHCAARQPTMFWENSGPPWRKKLTVWLLDCEIRHQGTDVWWFLCKTIQLHLKSLLKFS